ncbi:MAG: PHP domain-containing protein, partial [Methanomassiliicoccales archaeon]
GLLSPEKIVKKALKKGPGGLAITDHDTIKGGLEAKKYETKDFKVIIGSEIMTKRGEIIGLFLSDEIVSKGVHEVVAEIKEQNGIAIIPHPFDELRHSTLCPTEDDGKIVDAIEVFNSRCVYKEYNKKAMEFAKKCNLGMTAGSDAHYANEIGIGGIVCETENIREAILKNEVEVFGKRSSLVNHGFTKALKLWRKIKSG